MSSAHGFIVSLCHKRPSCAVSPGTLIGPPPYSHLLILPSIASLRSLPGVLCQLWWDTAPLSLRATLWMLLADLPPDLPLFLLGSADAAMEELEPEILQLFGSTEPNFHELSPPGKVGSGRLSEP